jgi:hypothetical protein
VRITFDNEQRRQFFRECYPARCIFVMGRESLRRADHIIAYDVSTQVFHLFASSMPVDVTDPNLGCKGSTLCFIFDQRTDDLELIAGMLILAGRELLYRGDPGRDTSAVVNRSDWYEAHCEELLAEVRAIDRRRELADKFQAEWN